MLRSLLALAGACTIALPMAAQVPAQPARPAPRARAAQPGSDSADRFTTIRKRYERELAGERAALQRTRDRMREEMVAAGWRPRAMRQGAMRMRMAKFRGSRRAMMARRMGPQRGPAPMMMRGRQMPAPGMQPGRGMPPGGQLRGRGMQPGPGMQAGPRRRAMPQAPGAVPRVPPDTTL